MNAEFNLDYNASQGVDPRVWQHLSTLNLGLNASSVHTAGQRARGLLEEARDSLSRLISLEKGNRIVFTSGATEANNTVLNSAYLQTLKHGKSLSLITTAIEHPSILEPAKRLQSLGSLVTLVSPRNGALRLDQILELVEKHRPDLVSVMFANNETGERFDIATLSQEVRRIAPSTKIHCDGVQGPGKCEVNFATLGVDYLSISGHKFGALCGVGALIVRSDHDLEPLLLGGVQESRYRAGTENVLGIASMGFAAQIVREELDLRIDSMLAARQYFEHRLLSEFPSARIIGPLTNRLPNTISINLPGTLADDLVVAADLKKILISSGAACSSGKPEPSHVLLAYGLGEDEARSTIRISLPPFLLCSEREYACEQLVAAIRSSRSFEAYAQ